MKVLQLAQADATAPAAVPATAPAEAPVAVPAEAPVAAPAEAPVAAPAEAPVAAPAEAPVAAPVPAAPVEAILEEVKTPAAAPAVPPKTETPAVPVELIEMPAAPAPVATVPAPAVEAPAPATPAETAAPATAPAVTMPAMDPAEAAKFLSQQVEVRKTEQELKAKKALIEANAALKRQNYPEAAALYQQVLDNLPVREKNKADREQAMKGLSEAQYYVIKSMIAAGKLQEAQDMAVTATKRDPEDRRLEKALATVQSEIADQKEEVQDQEKVSDARPWKSKAVKDIEEKVDKLIREGRGFLAVGDYKTAGEKFKSALSLEPENRTAMYYLEKTGDKRFASSAAEFKATSGNMVADVRDAWNPREYAYVPPTVTATNIVSTESGANLIKKMEEIIIPEIEFRQANIHDVVDFLVKASIAEDVKTTEAREKGVNIILNLGSNAGAAAAPSAAPADPFAPAPAGGAAPVVTGVPEITFTARYISLMQAIKIITSVAGLKYRVEGKIVMIVPADAPDSNIEHRWYSVEPSISQVLESAAPASGGGEASATAFGADLNTRVSGTRGSMEDYFKKLGVEFPKGASIQYQPNIGKLIVANTARNLSLIEQIIQEINVTPKQVEIEARFVEVNQTDLEELGFQWMLNDNWEVLTKKGSGTMPGGGERIQIAKNSGSGGFTQGLRFWGNADTELKALAAGQAGALMTIQSVLTNPEISMVLHALEQNGHADVLSAPKVTTRSGNEATIRVVTEYIYPTEFDIRSASDLIGTGSSTTTGTQPVEAKVVALPQNFETREVGVILSVIPEVSPEGNMINLNMRPEVVSDPTWHEYGVTLPDSNGNEYDVKMPQPFFQRRAVETQISIYDGATVVMGGLITEKIVTINDKVPFLGDIPLIGWLFRNKGSESQKRNLLIFVTARLVDPSGKPIRSQKTEDKAPLGVPPAVSATPR